MSEPSPLQFVDTDVLIYAHDRSAGEKHCRARDLIRDLWQSGQGCLSVQVLQEFYLNVTQKVARPLASEEAGQIIADLAAWQVHRPGAEDILDAIRLQERYRISFWDAMIVASAAQMGCQTIWSEDLNSGQTYDQVAVLNPFAE
jgi:predicted nucleic acid-binding protein